MPIKGISDVRRLPRLGKIKTGEKRVKYDNNGNPKKKKNGEEITYPVALDYFVCPPEVQEVYGEQPTELDVMFPLNNENIIFPQDMKKYGSTGLKCKGDGEIGYMSQNGELIQRHCDQDDDWCKDCQPRATLNVLLPSVPGFGVWQITTGSWNSIVNVNSQIAAIKAMTAGKISHIPLKLVIEPHEATVLTDDGKQFKKTVYVLRLDIKEKMGEFVEKFTPRQAPQLPGHIQDAADKFTDIRRQQYSDDQVLPAGIDAETAGLDPEWEHLQDSGAEQEQPAEPKQQNDNGFDVDEARRKFFAAMGEIASECGVSKEFAEEKGKGTVYRKLGVASMSELTPEQWASLVHPNSLQGLKNIIIDVIKNAKEEQGGQVQQEPAPLFSDQDNAV